MTKVMVSWTVFQKVCINGQDHQVWIIEPSSDLHLQHLSEIRGENLWRTDGVLYHLVMILKLHSCVATLSDPLCAYVNFFSQFSSVRDKSISLSQFRHDELEKSDISSNKDLYKDEMICLWGFFLVHRSSNFVSGFV